MATKEEKRAAYIAKCKAASAAQGRLPGGVAQPAPPKRRARKPLRVESYEDRLDDLGESFD